jgi:2-polyprenyl-3-methyl-5-hydroxy-6-metoxy-1,4-benzoquinol methylase
MEMRSRLTQSKLNRLELPSYPTYAQACKFGLSVIYPFKSKDLPDPYGWRFGGCKAPSYSAFGRMRALLAVHEALECQPKRVLEVAAGGCGLSATLANRGCDVSVNDLRAQHINEAIQEYEGVEGIKIMGGNMFELSSEQIGLYDLVIACEVIEHVAHPQDLLEHLRTFLAPDGRLLLTTPNGSYFRNRLPTYTEITNEDELEARQFKPDADGHLFLLTPEELNGLAIRAGLRVEKLGVWGTPLLSGHSGFRYLSSGFILRPAFMAEQLTQGFPGKVRKWLCTQLTVLLSAA